MIASILDTLDHPELTKMARQNQPNLKRWVSAMPGTGRRCYRDNLTGDIIDSESARWPMTKHAQDAIRERRAEHLRRLNGLD